MADVNNTIDEKKINRPESTSAVMRRTALGSVLKNIPLPNSISRVYGEVMKQTIGDFLGK